MNNILSFGFDSAIKNDMRGRQLSFFPKPLIEHGGSVRTGRRKIARPIDPARPIHLVLRAARAKGERSMLHRRNRADVDSLVYVTAHRFQLRIYGYANVGNHLHLVVKTPDRRRFQSFLRLLGGSVAMRITGARKGSRGRFWEKLAYSRLVSWGREFEALKSYITKNLLEGIGRIPRREVDRLFEVRRRLGRVPPPD